MPELEENRYNILVCIDGSEESFRGLRYALRFSLDHDDTDISLLYVRADVGGSYGGLNLSLTREALLEWDIELPGLKSLKKARDVLVESGFLGEEWDEEEIQKKFRGSRLGNHMIKYISKKTGQHITLIVRVDTSILAGILEEVSSFPYDIVIVSASPNEEGHVGEIDLYTAVSVATEHDGTVILARELEEGHGHFVCVTDSDMSEEMARKDARIAARCGCPIYLYSVAEDDSQKEAAERAIQRAKAAIEAEGMSVAGAEVEIGDPVQLIIERGREHSLIVLAATEKSRIKRLFMGSVSHDVLKKAKNSVMIIR